MKKYLVNYVLYIYLNFIKEDFYFIKKEYLWFIKLLWYIRSTFMWLMYIIFFPVFYIGMIIDGKMTNK